jgi:hypothetical protein
MTGKIKDWIINQYAAAFGPVYGAPIATINIGQGYDEIVKGIKRAIGADTVQIVGINKSVKGMPWGNQIPEEPISVEHALNFMLDRKLGTYEADAHLTAVKVSPAVFGRKESGYGIFGDCELTDGFSLPNAIGIDVYPVSEKSLE